MGGVAFLRPFPRSYQGARSVTDSPEFTAMLEKIPKHIMLTPGVHRWIKGDEILGARYTASNLPEWISALGSLYGQIIKSGFPARRPIPENVRCSAAWFALLSSMSSIKPGCLGYGLHVWFDPEINRLLGPKLEVFGTKGHFFELNLFETKEHAHAAIPLLGGEQNIIHHLSSGCLLPKWMAGEI